MDREHYPPSTKQSPSIPYRLSLVRRVWQLGWISKVA
ncbi:hypothetical protein SNOG_03341 [Parastagonospora nodorum SN15]|uniref:Uncharacterized protein n=1 Tax=Phaeosphaeria nodorum (strain SN15 / ATCC MYA-4574 / FGSC 10173) TaxID=321614 RepID=Q0UY23_PHANO|nr:hypothetical protein SNOG_03341 [Parastagonospora nodorum SN15]EAT88546.1 hypothetical protein SNOG_03341 [Parastagonospora nodorum SN15]